MKRFTLPRDLYHGENAISALKSLTGKTAVIVTGGSAMKKYGILDKAICYVKEAGLHVTLFEGVEPDPSVETVLKGAEVMKEVNPDWIIAIGGGSAIDAAKAMWVFYEYPDITFEELCVPFSFPTLRTKAKFCGIPSTSGTATEVTAFSVITDYKKGIKYPLADFNITPDIAIVDPVLASTMPPKLTAYTGMDALTHAIEAYVSTESSDYTDALAIHAIKLINENIIESFNEDTRARAKMHDCSTLAGMAFSNALLGIVHSMAHKTGAAYSSGHIPHGCANAMYLPKVIAFNMRDEYALNKYAEIADTLKINGKSKEEKVCNLINHITELNKKLNIPLCIKDYENGLINEKEFLDKLKAISQRAISDACTLSNPRKISQDQMEKLLLCCYYNKDVNF